jgi:hypothetical protein
MTLKPQDVLVVLQLATLKNRATNIGFVDLSTALGLSLGAVHASFARAKNAGLIALSNNKTRTTDKLLPFLTHGVPICFYAERGEITRGIPTGIHAPILEKQALAEQADVPVVWPHPDGTVRGETLQPLYKTVPRIAKTNRDLYDLLALVDVLRAGRPKEKAAVILILEKKLA